MILSFLLLLLGIFLIFIEFYLPGGIMGIGGGILVFASVILFAFRVDSPLYIALYVLFVLILVIVLIKWTLWRIQNTKSKRSIYSFGDQGGFYASGYDKEAIGKKGIVSSDLKPGGYIVIEQKSYSAISLSGYLPKETEVIVVSGEGETLYVKPVKKENV